MSGPLQFQVSLFGKGGEGAAQTFWERALAQTWGRGRPALAGKSGGALGKVVPLMIHVDGVEIYSNTEFVVFSVASPLSYKSNIWDAKFAFLKIPGGVDQR